MLRVPFALTMLEADLVARAARRAGSLRAVVLAGIAADLDQPALGRSLRRTPRPMRHQVRLTADEAARLGRAKRGGTVTELVLRAARALTGERVPTKVLAVPEVARALAAAGGSPKGAARLLGVDVMTVRRRVDAFGLPARRLPPRPPAEVILATLAEHAGNISHAARALGVDRRVVRAVSLTR